MTAPGPVVLFNNLRARDYSSLQRMIPPACNLAVTFTAEMGSGLSLRVKARTPPANWPPETLWEKRAKRMGVEPWGEEERETGERQEISGRNNEERN